jgi:2-polyprenyl-6-methoxyphenol hydroxylase-like FAD-dependent oxidoreductase
MPKLATWHRGAVVVLGDAAHAMSPAGGQGASLALEDARLFASLVADPARPVGGAMARFEALRRQRVEAIVAQAYLNDRRTLQPLGPAAQWTRDHLLMPLFARFIERSLAQTYAAS